VSSTLSGVVQQSGDGFIVLHSGISIRFTSQVFSGQVAPGTRVVVKARLGGSEWIADDIQLVEDA
jgi:hypothetical protein